VSARIRIEGLFLVVAHDRDKALDELAPYFLHVNNSYGEWLNGDRASTGMGDTTLLKPMTLEAFKKSGILHVLTPPEAIALFNDMRAKAPVEHFTMMLPPGLAPAVQAIRRGVRAGSDTGISLSGASHRRRSPSERLQGLLQHFAATVCLAAFTQPRPRFPSPMQ
jgi:hypothetical protein